MVFCGVFAVVLHVFCGSSLQLTLPPWPLYRRKPLSWQKARPDHDEEPAAAPPPNPPAGSHKCVVLCCEIAPRVEFWSWFGEGGVQLHFR